MFYKVVSYGHELTNGEYRDAYFSLAAGNITRVKYDVGKFSEALAGTGLLVFDSLEAVKNTVGCLNQYGVFECEVEDEVALPKYALQSAYYIGPTAVKFYWETGVLPYHLIGDLQCINWPRGTRAFRRVKLTKQVK